MLAPDYSYILDSTQIWRPKASDLGEIRSVWPGNGLDIERFAMSAWGHQPPPIIVSPYRRLMSAKQTNN